MNPAVKNKLIEILAQAYGGQVRETYDACVAAQAALAGATKQPVAAYQRCLTDGKVLVKVTPFATHGPGGNHVVQFMFALTGLPGDVSGSINAEAATEAMRRWVVTEADVVAAANPATPPQALEHAILNLNATALRCEPCR